MPSAPDPGVLAAARVGSGWAFERLYELLSPGVLGYLRAQGCRDPEGAANEVFLRVFRRIGSFNGTDAQMRSWVFTIAHNLLVDERRTTSRRLLEQPLHDRLEVAGGDVEADAEARLGVGWVRQVLDLLVAEQRDVLLMRVIAELSLEEVAEATGRSVGAVKSLQHRALANLRRRLQEIAPEAVSPSLT